MIIVSKKYPNKGNPLAISDNNIETKPKRRFDRRNHLG